MLKRINKTENKKSAPGSVFGNTAWGAAGRLLGGLFALVSLALISRTLGPEEYGVYATVLAFFFLINAIADGGLYQILVRDLGKPGSNEAQLLSVAMTLRLVLVGIATIIGLGVFVLIPQYQSLIIFAPLAALSYIPLSLGQLLMAVFQKHLTVKIAAVIEVGARLTQLLGIAGLYLLDVVSIQAFLAIFIIATSGQLFLLIRAAQKYVQFSLGTTIKQAREMAKEALPIGISLIFTLTYFRLDTVLLSLFKESEVVGIYNLSYKLLEQLIFFPAMFLGVLTPILMNAFIADREKFTRIIAQTARVLTITALPLLVGGWFLATPLALLLGGEAFSAAAEPLRVLLLGTVLIFAGSLFGALIVVIGKQKKAVPVYALAMVISIGMNLILIPRFSYMGTAWVTVITELIVDFGLLSLLLKAGVRLYIPKLFRILLSLGIMTIPLVLFATKAIEHFGVWSLVPFLIVCPVLYFASLFWMRAITRDDIALFTARQDTL